MRKKSIKTAEIWQIVAQCSRNSENLEPLLRFMFLVLNVDWMSLCVCVCDQVAHNCPVMLFLLYRFVHIYSTVERFYPLPVVMASLRRAFFVCSGVHYLSCLAL